MKIPALAVGVLLLSGIAAAQNTTETSTEVTRLIEQLGDPEYELRTGAEKALVKRGKAVLEQLRRSAKSSADPEIQWRAGRLVRRIEAGDLRRGGLSRRIDRAGKLRLDGDSKRVNRRSAAGSGAIENLDEVFEALRGSLGEGGLDPKARAALERAMRQLRSGLGERGGVKVFDFPGVDFPGLESMKFDVDALRRISTQGRSMKMTTGPDGVRVEIEETGEGGKKQRKVYEAEDMDSFRRKHPGVLDSGPSERGGMDLPPGFLWRRGSGGSILQPRISRDGKGGLRIELDAESHRDSGSRRKIVPPVATAGKKLGFYVGEMAPSVREYLGLGDGRGLMVDRITAGSLAEQLKLHRGDIVVKVGDTAVYGVGDVQAGLEKLGDAEVRVEVIRRGRPVTLRRKHRLPADKTRARVLKRR